MLLTASRRAQVLQEASRELDMEKLAILGKLISKATGGAMMKTPKLLSKAQRTAMIAEPVMPAASAARRSARLAAQKGPRTAPVASRAGTGGGKTLAEGARKGSATASPATTRQVPQPVGTPMSSAEQVAGTAIGRPPPALPDAAIQAARQAPAAAATPSLAQRAVLPLGLAGGSGGLGYAMSDQGAVHTASALSSLGPEKLASLARALEQEKEAGLLRAALGAAKTGLKGLKAGGSTGGRMQAAHSGKGFLAHRLSSGAKAAKSGWRKGMDPWAAKAKSLGGKPGVVPAAAATKAAPAAVAKAAPAAVEPAARGGLGLKGSTAVLGTGLLGGSAAVLGTQGALEGRSAQYVGSAPGRR